MAIDLKNPQSGSNALSPQNIGWAALVLGAMMVLVFADVMVLGGARVLSKVGCDIYSGSLAGREFVFGQLLKGNFALWCPSVLGGFPCFGAFQSGLVYPLSFPYLFMPAAAAINWSFILHMFLGGMFMYFWLGRQNLHRFACLAGALMFAFCAPFYLRLYPGHLTPHSAIAWIPLVFLAIDGIIATPTLGWLLLGTTAVSMEMLAGYPQVLFYTAIASLLYTLAKISESPEIRKAILLLVLMNVFTLGLTCVQWEAGAVMAGECVRKGGVQYRFAAMFSLPPENWLTLIRPGLFGDMENFPYWGRWYLWEMCLYFGTIGLFFSVVGLLHSRRRRILTVAGIAAVMGVLALGGYSPHFRFFYEHVPFFNMFRSNSKFIILVVVFLIYLSAHGMDLLFRENAGKRLTERVFAGVAAACAVLVALVCVVKVGGPRLFWNLMSVPINSGEVYFDPAAFLPIEVVSKAARFAAGELCMALYFLGGLALLLGLLWWRPRWRQRLAAAIVGLLALELLLFALQEHVSFPPNIVRMPDLERYLKANLGDGRVFSPDGSNVAMTMDGVCDMWGYGSDGVIRRYAEFLAFTQGNDPEMVTGYQVFKNMHPRFDLLRCKYVLFPHQDGTRRIVETPGGLPKFLLVTDWRVVEKRDEVFTAISRPEFNPRHSVLLERNPAGWPAPSGAVPDTAGQPGQVRILRESTNWQEVEVTLAKPAILLQTDLYTPNWHVYAVPGSAQAAYELIPADYILRAVPLKPGTYRLRIEYRPGKFVVGRSVSLATLAMFAVLFGFWGFRNWKRRERPSLQGKTL
jgi:hypothetical protein